MTLNKRIVLITFLMAIISVSLLLSASGQNDAKYGIREAARDLGNINTFVAALDTVDLMGTLNNEGVLNVGNKSFVVFTPNDQAFNSMPAGYLDALWFNKGNLKDVIDYHIIDNNNNVYNDLSKFTSIKTREGDNVTIGSRNGLAINGVKILTTRKYDHGTIYVIDRVLMPPKALNQTIKDINQSIKGAGVLQALSKAGGLSKFIMALEEADLVGRLDGQGTLGTHAGPFTIFAPNDAAFNAIPANTTNYLMANKSDLKTILNYHIIGNTDVQNMTAPGSVKTEQGGQVPIDTKNGVVVDSAKTLDTLKYGNGIIYVIDRMLVPNDKNLLNKYKLNATMP